MIDLKQLKEEMADGKPAQNIDLLGLIEWIEKALPYLKTQAACDSLTIERHPKDSISGQALRYSLDGLIKLINQVEK